MFQSLRPNNQIFILHKDKSLLEVGSVVSVSMPTPKYPVPQVFGQPQDKTVVSVSKGSNLAGNLSSLKSGVHITLDSHKVLYENYILVKVDLSYFLKENLNVICKVGIYDCHNRFDPEISIFLTNDCLAWSSS